MEDIHTLDEALEDPEWDYDEFDPDYTRAMAEDAIQTGEIRVYSSYPITEGVFVTPSEMEAESYSADGRKILYDIGPIKKVGQSVKSDTSLLSAGQRGNSRTSTAESSVAEKLPPVKGQYSLTQAAEGRKMSSRARRDVNQTMNAVQTELRGLIEAETRAAWDVKEYLRTQGVALSEADQALTARRRRCSI